MGVKRVLLFSRDIGGCNSIAPLYSFLSLKGLEVHLYAKDISFQKMRTSFSLYPKNIDDEPNTEKEDFLENWLTSQKPDVVITGTSHGDFTERSIWSACEKLRIPTFAILDHWINYEIRFRKHDGEHIFPTYIIVPDSDGTKLAIDEGMPANRLHSWGNPYYDYLESRDYPDSVRQLRQKFLCNTVNDKLIVFASESFSKAPVRFGYMEKDILKKLIFSIRHNLKKDHVSLIVRPHPKEDPQELINICNNHRDESLSIFVSSEENSLDLIQASDLVCGMISQFLIESAILKKRSISIQIGLNAPDPFILTQKGVIPLVTNTSDLDKAIQTFQLGKMPTPELKTPHGCMETILKKLETIL